MIRRRHRQVRNLHARLAAPTVLALCGALALVFTAAGYFTIYLVRPLDLAWLLDTSSDRLLLQLWPGIVFVIFLACRAPHRSPFSVPSHL